MAKAQRRRPHEPALYGRRQQGALTGEGRAIVSRVIRHEGLDIEVRIKRSRRKTLAIHVYPDQPVELRAPLKCPWREIDGFIASKAEWIRRSREHFARHPPPRAPRYVDGESHPYLGESYRLQIVRGRPARLWLINDIMLVRCASPGQPDKVRTIMENWYRERARILLPERLASCFETFTSTSSVRDIPALTIRKMRARWGSCSSTGEICLNSILVQKAPPIIDYVIMHELCHLVHFSHDKPFYRLMSRVMPDWRERAASLESSGSVEPAIP